MKSLIDLCSAVLSIFYHRSFILSEIMERQVLQVCCNAVCCSLILLMAIGGTDGPGINNSSDSCCSGRHSKVYQSNQMITDKDGMFSTNLAGDEVLHSYVAIPTSIENMTCTATWFTPRQSSNGSTSCECGSSLGSIIKCDAHSKDVELLKCYCMTFSVDESMLVVGPCMYGCVMHYGYNPHYPLPSNTSELSIFCNNYNREGQLCGRCKPGFALPVYSYNLTCVECQDHYASNWVKYVAASFLPLTLFFIIMVTLRVRVTSGVMNAFILVCQVITLPALSRMYVLVAQYREYSRTVFSLDAVLLSLCGIWNLDFFRLLYPSFCLHPKTTSIQIIALDYVIAVYPLVLLVVAYLLVKLHDSDICFNVLLWRPFHRCFVNFRRDWNIKTSLVDAFATFLLLSYTKFLSVSLDLLAPVQVMNSHSNKLNQRYLYWDATIEFFGRKHLPYAILALAVLIIFTLLPLLLMCLYPSRKFQKFLNHYKLQSQALHIFMDAFQGCYKDGTNGTCDYRWFAGLYLFMRILFILTLGVTVSDFFIPLSGLLVLFLLLLTALLQPYKCPAHNRINIFLLLAITFVVIASMATLMASSRTVQFIKVSNWIARVSFSLLPTYFVGIVLYKMFAHRMCVRKLRQKLCRILCRKADGSYEDYDRLFPERMVNVEECAALLADPMQVNISNEEPSVLNK